MNQLINKQIDKGQLQFIKESQQFKKLRPKISYLVEQLPIKLSQVKYRSKYLTTQNGLIFQQISDIQNKNFSLK
ncbi:hypothetical protein TTHERM_01339570 (macronuclear) [Tetrahymena thermophila SB210]|uniref:Uncharacterized protein n=1 Tax=Tetrahymena thermophila (strain SB210) TaxID=312017 RepID=Q24HR0_TETTS|nr:hypothetical protein TTHERM_01339570 [Tetrahymena thermophila SB210]EAS07303.1 hypothetical protein TTHERM_01339570 [Tetrahymena thermophila SB210]|eukprot:XP_001027545.1 hypothetical protein TTHERM_01339570 [Tetrahymena thermophila SB210]